MTKARQRTPRGDNPTVPVTIRISPQALKLIEAIQIDRGDAFRSGTLSIAVDRMIEEHYPGALKGASAEPVGAT